MYPQDYPRRYLHIAGGFAAGGTLTRIGPDVHTNLPIQTVAPVDLPMVGGISENTTEGVALTGRHSGVAGLSAELMNRELISIGWAHSLVQSDPFVEGGPVGSRTLTEARSIRLDAGAISIESLRLEMRSVHLPGERLPQMSFVATTLNGLRLGGHDVSLTFDLNPFNRYPTLDALETAFKNSDDLKRDLTPRFLLDQKTGGFYRNESGYVVGSILKSVSGLPPGATLDGYTINWKGFGRIILGEVFMGAYVRRATLIRVEHSSLDGGSGCTGGSWYP